MARLVGRDLATKVRHAHPFAVDGPYIDEILIAAADYAEAFDERESYRLRGPAEREVAIRCAIHGANRDDVRIAPIGLHMLMLFTVERLRQGELRCFDFIYSKDPLIEDDLLP